MNKKVEWVTKFFKKLYTRFMNYNNSKKWFVLYLVILSLVLLFFPLIEIKPIGADITTYRLFSTAYLKSLIVVLISLAFLFGWNTSIQFKKKVIELFALREDEPLVDFSLLWVITTIFMGILDTMGIAQNFAGTISLTHWTTVSEILLVGGLVRSFINILKLSKQTTKHTKIFNLGSDINEKIEKPDEEKNNKQVHLFDNLDKEEE